MTDLEPKSAAELERDTRLAWCKARALLFLAQGEVANAFLAFIAETRRPLKMTGLPLIDWDRPGIGVLLTLGMLHVSNYRNMLAELGINEADVAGKGKAAGPFGYDHDLKLWIEGFR